MNKKELKAKLFKQLALLLTEEGFGKRIYGQSIKKPIDNGTATIHLAFINHVDDFDVTVDAGIRFDELENMKNESNLLLTSKEKARTSSIGVELGNISIGKPKRWTIKSEGNIDLVTQSIFEDIKLVLLPFIEKYSCPEKVFELCIKDDSEAKLICPLDDKRAINAVGLAIILKKEDELNELIQKKKKYLEEKQDMGLSMYLGFIEKYNN
ncbi:hypothetical protein [Cytobacillus horneckiae]|uniref:hypothetical protein n=1 Tax=Cytobacillus horneckiae TaxID=549687 RepID=UPI003D9A4425